MEKEKKARPGPKPTIYNEDVAHFFIRDVPVSLRNRAKSKAAVLGISLKDFLILALTEKIETTP